MPHIAGLLEWHTACIAHQKTSHWLDLPRTSMPTSTTPARNNTLERGGHVPPQTWLLWCSLHVFSPAVAHHRRPPSQTTGPSEWFHLQSESLKREQDALVLTSPIQDTRSRIFHIGCWEGRWGLLHQSLQSKPPRRARCMPIDTTIDDSDRVIRLKRIYNFWCSMLVFTPFA
jgi:hypothetical protein